MSEEEFQEICHSWGPMLEQCVPERIGSVIQSRVGAVLEELQPMGIPCRIRRVASCRRDPTWSGGRVTMKEQHRRALGTDCCPIPLCFLVGGGRGGWMGGRWL